MGFILGPTIPIFSLCWWKKAPSSMTSFCRIDAEPKMVSALLKSPAAEPGILFCSESVCGDTHNHGHTALGPELTPNQPCLSTGVGLAPKKPRSNEIFCEELAQILQPRTLRIPGEQKSPAVLCVIPIFVLPLLLPPFLLSTNASSI